MVPPQTWTQKITAPFKSTKTPSAVQQTSSSTATKDSISLAFGSGPPTASLYISMAQMSEQGGTADHARAMYQKALGIEPKNLDALLGLARLEDREGNLPLAQQIYQQAVSFHPEDPRALNDLALCLARAGQFPQSFQALDKAVRLRPDKPLYRNNIAKVLIELNQIPSAIAHLEAVSEPAVANYNLAVMLSERGRNEAAVRHLEIALSAKPQFQEASALLVKLRGGAGQTLASEAKPNPTPANNLHVSPGPAVNANDDILPTPMTPPGMGNPATAYPTTGAAPLIPQPISLPGQTAQLPAGYSAGAPLR